MGEPPAPPEEPEEPGGPAPQPRAPRRVWRDNLEALALAFVVAIFLKYFAIEAYRIPSGSMQPTLMGWQDGRGGGLFDRILVDKLSFHQRDPERFEVVVFQFPLDRSKHFVKRVVGLPGDSLRIARGDLWLEQEDPSGLPAWRIVRRPAQVQEAHWFAVPSGGRWDLGEAYATWTRSEGGLLAEGPGEASFPGDASGVRDHAEHGYPAAVLERMGRPKRSGGANDVGDLRLSLELTPSAECSAIELWIEEAGIRHLASLPGPAAAPDARPRLRSGTGRRLAQLDQPWRLPAGAATRVRLWNLDDRLDLELDGEVVLQLEVAPARRGAARLGLATRGGGARFERLGVERDLFYDTAGAVESAWRVPEGHYFMLGDNVHDSSDSRAWSLTHVHSTDGAFEGTLTGQQRPDENPMPLLGTEHHDSVAFVDQWGERYTFRSTRVHSSTRPAPFVPRHLLRGRALLIFWPLNPLQNIHRLHWIH